MTIFSDIKAAISASPEIILKSLGITFIGSFKGQWAAAKCPLCDDSGGSASLTPTGFLNCHQCMTKLDLFQWVGKRDSISVSEAAKNLAETLKVEARPVQRQKRAGALPMAMDEDILERSIDELWTSKAAEPVRKFLSERKLDSDPELIGELGVGFIKGYIIFAQRDQAGRIQNRYRGYLPGGNLKWQWFGRGSGGPGIWLSHREVGERVLLLEGEWDVLTAIVRLRLHEAGWTVVTWTAGASSSPSTGDIPKTWKGKDVHICYDNDVFQGPDFSKYWCKDKKGEQKVIALRKNLLGKVAPTFKDAGCNVWIRQIPISPEEIWGGDFRDWVDSGGNDISLLPLYKYDTLASVTTDEQQLEFDEIWDGHIGERVRTRTQVAMIAGDDYVVPTLSLLKCQQGQLSCCSSCAAPKFFQDGMVPLEQYQEHVAIGIAKGDVEQYLLKHVIKRPKSCPEARLTTIEGKSASYWKGIRPGSGDDTRQRTLSVVSTQPPSLSGEVDIAGHIHSDSSNVIFFADQVYQLDRAEVDLGTSEFDLRQITPFDAQQPEQIDEYLDYRWMDLSKNVTRVFGRRDVHVACELLFHSVTGITVSNKVRRGWLDAALIGDTRTGKSMTVRGLIDWLRLGSIHSAVDNVSRAGLIMGADHHGMMRPGLMTKSHRKLLALDEFHWLVNSRKLGDDHPMSWMQSARDEGKVFGVKIYGDRTLPAKVRLLTISNWAKSRRRSFSYACEHFSWLYGSPETISRLDFGLVVEGPPSQNDFDEVRHIWTLDLTKALILRAWAQEPHQVIITAEAELAAFEISDSWKHLYAYDKVSLYTPEEKPYSILRIATAVANICFSHVKEDPYSVVVKPVHVQWACQWLRHCYDLCGYDQFSQSTMVNDANDSPFSIERLLTVKLRLDDPTHAPRILALLMGGVQPQQDSILLGLSQESERFAFFGQGAKINALTPGKGDEKGKVVLTDPAHDVAMRLCELARNSPDVYVERYKRLAAWAGDDNVGIVPIHLMEA